MSAFEITEDDLALLGKLSPEIGGKTYSLPPPTLCFECRLRQKLCFHNEQHLYKRTCDFSGKSIISMYKPDAPVKVYDCDIWYSDAWDPLTYGKDIDFERPFFEQFHELLAAVPQLALSVVREYNVNSDYTNNNWKMKNCYLVSNAEECEGCSYGQLVEFSRDCMDVFAVQKCELCYECLNCIGSYNLRYCQFCNNCSDSWFLRDCTGCRHCFACANLHQKEYCIFNEQKTRTEYEAFLKNFASAKCSAVEDMHKRSMDFFLTKPVKATRGVQNIQVTGDIVSNSKNAHQCFDCKDLQDCRYMTNCQQGAKDSWGIHVWGAGMELCCEGCVVGKNVQRILFSYFVLEQCQSILYSLYCMRGSSDLFGCIGLRRKKYCILNKQYSQKEYEELSGRLIKHMQKTGEWGQYFPSAISPFGYNETDANLYLPLSKEDAVKKGFHWSDYEPIVEADRTIPATKLPDDSSDIPDDVLNWAIVCETSGKPFKLTTQELRFYREHHLPIPRRHPEQRHHDRFAYKNPYRLWMRGCAKCRKEIQTSYAPQRPEKIYCEECYLQMVY